MFGYTQEEALGSQIGILMPSPHREAHKQYLRHYADTKKRRVIGETRRLQARRKDGTLFPVDLSVSEIERLGLYTGVIRDVSEHAQLQNEVLRIAIFEQRRIAQDLHDGVQQEVFGLQLLAQNLRDSLPDNAGEAKLLASQVHSALGEVSGHLRQIAKGLMPVEVDVNGLMAALERLAVDTSAVYSVICEFECPKVVRIKNDLVATHLHSIAHEGIANVVKHANAKSIMIKLETTDDGQLLSVADDGVGIAEDLGESTGEHYGMRIMRYRCNLIGGRFAVESRPGGGTVVQCMIPAES
jgi:PAS domain S-box-containing protein